MGQYASATQQAYAAMGDGQWADRFSSILDIMNERLQSHLQIAVRYRNQIQHGNDSKIAAAITRFDSVRNSGDDIFGQVPDTF